MWLLLAWKALLLSANQSITINRIKGLREGIILCPLSKLYSFVYSDEYWHHCLLLSQQYGDREKICHAIWADHKTEVRQRAVLTHGPFFASVCTRLCQYVIWGFGNGLKKAQKNKNTSCAKPWIHWAARLSRLYLFRQQKTYWMTLPPLNKWLTLFRGGRVISFQNSLDCKRFDLFMRNILCHQSNTNSVKLKCKTCIRRDSNS